MSGKSRKDKKTAIPIGFDVLNENYGKCMTFQMTD